MTYVIPFAIIVIFIIGIITYEFADDFTILGWISKQ